MLQVNEHAAMEDQRQGHRQRRLLARVAAEWVKLPTSRRLHPTDVVAFTFRLLRDRPDMFRGEDADPETIVAWLLPHCGDTGREPLAECYV